jgi:ubiquinone/menaquinone biosynthesis C-methylase UbiE
MAELHEDLRLVLPDVIRDPYKATSEMLNRFILTAEEVRRPVIKEDIAELEGQVKKFEKVISGKVSPETFDRLVPYRFLADREYDRQNYEEALLYYDKALLQNPNDLSILFWMAWSYIWTKNFGKAIEISEEIIKKDPSDHRGYLAKGHALIYSSKSKEAIMCLSEALKYVPERTRGSISILTSRSHAFLIAGRSEEALSDAESVLRIFPEDSASVLNKCIALKKLNKIQEAKKIIADFLPKIKYAYHRAAAFAVLEDKENMLRELGNAIELSENQYATSNKYESRIYINTKFKTNPKSKFKWIFEHFPKNDNLKVLELGCGTGLFWLANRNEIPNSWSITLSDYSEGMLEGTRNTLSKINRDFKYEVVNAEDINYPDKHFDIILANNMLYHIENRSIAISHIFRILKDDGVFITSTVGKNDMLELNQYLYDFLESRNKSFKFRELPFSLDNGLGQLLAYFPKVTISRYEDMLKIDKVEPIIDYYRSFNGMYNDLVVLYEEDIDAFRIFLQNIIDSKKAISVTKDSGIFICTK